MDSSNTDQGDKAKPAAQIHESSSGAGWFSLGPLISQRKLSLSFMEDLGEHKQVNLWCAATYLRGRSWAAYSQNILDAVENIDRRISKWESAK